MGGEGRRGEEGELAGKVTGERGWIDVLLMEAT